MQLNSSGIQKLVWGMLKTLWGKKKTMRRVKRLGGMNKTMKGERKLWEEKRTVGMRDKTFRGRKRIWNEQNSGQEGESNEAMKQWMQIEFVLGGNNQDFDWSSPRLGDNNELPSFMEEHAIRSTSTTADKGKPKVIQAFQEHVTRSISTSWQSKTISDRNISGACDKKHFGNNW